MANGKKTDPKAGKPAASPKPVKAAKVKPVKAAKVKPVKAARPAAVKTPKKKKGAGFKVLVAGIAVTVIAGGVLGGLWLGGVFKPSDTPTFDHAVDFASTLSNVEIEETRELASVYQDGDVLHLLYKSGVVKSTFIQLLTTPEKRTPLNSGGSITFTKGTVTSSSISEGITRNTSINHEASYTYSLTSELGATVGVASIKVTGQHTFGYKFGYTSSVETSYVKEESNSVTVEESHSTPLSECEEGHYYAYALYSDFDVFMDVGVKLHNGGLKVVSAQTYYGMHEGRNSIVFVGSETNDFRVPDELQTPKLPLVNSVSLEEIFFEGDGTAGNPYLIFSAPQLLYMGAMPNKSFKLMEDISLGSLNWNNNITFSGRLYGNNKRIMDLKRTDEAAPVSDTLYYGLFAQLTGYVENLTLFGFEIERKWDESIKDTEYPSVAPANQGSGKIFAGLLAGVATRCEVKNIIIERSTIEVWRNNSSVGAFFGQLNGVYGSGPDEMQSCKARGVIVKGCGDIGILLGGMSGGEIRHCEVDSYSGASGAVFSELHFGCYSHTPAVGGMVGWTENAAVTGGFIRNTKFIFTGGGENPNRADNGGDRGGYAPRIGVVVGSLGDGATIYKVTVPSEAEVRSLLSDQMPIGDYQTNKHYSFLPVTPKNRYSSNYAKSVLGNENKSIIEFGHNAATASIVYP